MKKVLLFVYDSFAEFEISVLITCLSSSFELVTCSVKPINESVISIGKLKILPDISIEEVDVEEYEGLIIPGGNPLSTLDNDVLKTMVGNFYMSNKIIGAICGGPAVLGAAGILNDINYTASLSPIDNSEYDHVMNWNNKREEFLVVDKNIVTSTGSNYIKFAEEIMRKLKIVSPEEVDPLVYFKVPSMN